MTMPPNRPVASGEQSEIPVFLINPAEVDESFEVFAAMRRTAQREPGLTDNKQFCAMQDIAYARFLANFEAM